MRGITGDFFIIVGVGLLILLVTIKWWYPYVARYVRRVQEDIEHVTEEKDTTEDWEKSYRERRAEADRVAHEEIEQWKRQQGTSRFEGPTPTPKRYVRGRK